MSDSVTTVYQVLHFHEPCKAYATRPAAEARILEIMASERERMLGVRAAAPADRRAWAEEIEAGGQRPAGYAMPHPSDFVIAEIEVEGAEALTPDAYQDWTASLALYPGKGLKGATAAVYTAFGLAGECGEVVATLLDSLSWEECTTVGKRLLATLESVVAVAKQCEILKKEIRDAGVALPAGLRISDETDGVGLELGDLVWYLARHAAERGLKFSEVLAANVRKLEDRRARGALQGSGDKR